MLAERKKKQKISTDPQNQNWKNDKGGFGFKMLQKMGWKEGDGLGTNNTGIVEHVRVEFKDGTTGIGMDKRDADEKYEQLDAYEQLLQSLNQSQPEVQELECSINDKSQSKPTRSKSKSKSSLQPESKSPSKSRSKTKSKSSSKPRSKTKSEPHSSNQQTTHTTLGGKHTHGNVMLNRLAHRKKYILNKQVTGYAQDSLQEIFGKTNN